MLVRHDYVIGMSMGENGAQSKAKQKFEGKAACKRAPSLIMDTTHPTSGVVSMTRYASWSDV